MKRFILGIAFLFVTYFGVNGQANDLGGCFEQNELQHYYGAVPYIQITELDPCLNLCLEHDDCIGVDWNHRDVPYQGTRCWLHMAPAGDPVANPNVDHHARIPCQEEACVDAFIYMADIHSEGASWRPTASTIEECQERCREEQCVVIDWDYSGSAYAGCWLHLTEENVVLEMVSTVDQYWRDPCDGEPSDIMPASPGQPEAPAAPEQLAEPAEPAEPAAPGNVTVSIIPAEDVDAAEAEAQAETERQEVLAEENANAGPAETPAGPDEAPLQGDVAVSIVGK